MGSNPASQTGMLGLSNGVELMVVSRTLGHESIKTAVEIHGHLQDNQRRQALSSLALCQVELGVDIADARERPAI